MPPLNYTAITLGELLSSKDKTIYRNACSIFKTLQRQALEIEPETLDGQVTIQELINKSRQA